MVELPVDVQTLLDADAVIVTHTHADHWDQYAVELIAKGKPIYVQNDSDAALLRSEGIYQPDDHDRGNNIRRYPDSENPRRPARY